LTGAQLQKALTRFQLGELVSTELVVSGLFGQNLFVTSTTGKYVLRGCPHYPWQFPKEHFFARLLHERTKAPVPWPYLRDTSTDIFGWEYVIMPRMPGLQIDLREITDAMSREDKVGLGGAMGETLAHMHELTWDHVGEYDAEKNAIKPLNISFSKWIYKQVKGELESARKVNDRVTDSDVKWIEGLLARASNAFRVQFTPTYVHHDYREGNSVADKIDGKWRVTGVFDLMEGYFGDGEEDMSRYLADHIVEEPEVAEEFVRSYNKVRTLRSGFEERFPIFMLKDRIGIWGYGQEHDWFKPSVKFREWLEPTLKAPAI